MARPRIHNGEEKILASNLKRVLVAPDSFKGSLGAAQVAAAVSRGVSEVLPGCTVVCLPISDGGEGLVDVLVPAFRGEFVHSRVSGPLPDQEVVARWGIGADGKTAIVEMAEAAGLLLVPPDRRDPKRTTTFGVGQLLVSALDRGVDSIIIGIGGSATNDGGAGMAEALGVRFLDVAGTPLERGGAALLGLASIDVRGLDRRLKRVNIDVACDVNNPLVGPNGASAVFGPQKGGTPADVELLNRALDRYREVLAGPLGIDVQMIPGSGAAGGLGAGLAAFCNARLKRGIDIVLDATGFDEQLRNADLVITGEGKIDMQTRYGKTIAGVMERARRYGKPVIAVVGSVEGKSDDYIGGEGMLDMISLVNDSTSIQQAMASAGNLVQRRTRELLLRLIGTGS